MLSKQEIRKEMLEKRSRLTPEEVDAGGLQLLERLQAGGYLQAVKTAFVYVSAKGEVSTFPLISYLLARGVQVCVPKTFKNGYMEAHVIRSAETDLQPGAYGIPEPVGGCKAATENIDLVLVPGVAFDKCGNRIGYGAGYYDRFFGEQLLSESVKKVAACYDFQMVERIPVEDTDRPMDAVVQISTKIV